MHQYSFTVERTVARFLCQSVSLSNLVMNLPISHKVPFIYFNTGIFVRCYINGVWSYCRKYLYIMYSIERSALVVSRTVSFAARL